MACALLASRPDSAMVGGARRYCNVGRFPSGGLFPLGSSPIWRGAIQPLSGAFAAFQTAPWGGVDGGVDPPGTSFFAEANSKNSARKSHAKWEEPPTTIAGL